MSPWYGPCFQEAIRHRRAPCRYHIPSEQRSIASSSFLRSIFISLLTRSVSLISHTPSQADVAIFKALTEPQYLNIARWYYHIKSYEAEFGTLPGSSSAGEAFLGGAAAPAAAAPAAAAPAAADDDDEIDLFGSDDEVDEEAERIKAERVAAYNAKKADKPKTAAKVRILFLFLS
jgi:elongation factor 1-beta